MRLAIAAALVVACSGSEGELFPGTGASGTGGSEAGGVTATSSSATVGTTTGQGGAATTSTVTGQGGAGGIDPPECVVPADCPGEDNYCRSRTCAGGVCGVDFVPAGTPAGPQTPGDCYTAVCDGAGTLGPSYTPADIEDDGQECTVDACTMQGPTYEPKSKGTPCSQGAGHLCDDATCVEFIPVKCKVGGTTYTGCDGQNHPGQTIGSRPVTCTDADDYGYCPPGEICAVNINGQSQGAGVCL